MKPPVESTTPAEEARGQRADARRNRERIVEAARNLMGEQGLEVGMDDIARAAGVGVGTLYRHFPTKEALIEALADHRFERLSAWAAEALADEGDPWGSLERFLRRGAELQAGDRALAEVMRSRGDVMRDAAERHGLLELNRKLVARAKRAGQIRAEFRAEDIPMLMCGLGTATCSTPGEMAGPDGWRRYLDILLTGIRAPGAK